MKIPTIHASNTKLTFEKYISRHKNYIFQNTFLFGAVLFRGFEVNSKLFEQGVDCFELKNYELTGSAAPRTKISSSVWTSNDSPPCKNIPMHHEMAQNINPPSYIFFNCQTPSTIGGETPILDSRKLANYIKKNHGDIYIKLKKGVYYTRSMSQKDNPSSALGRGWENTFNKKDKSSLEVFLNESDMKFKWLDNNCLQVKTKLTPAFRYNERTKEETFFNSIIAAYTGWNDELNNGKTSIQYSDDTYLEEYFISDVSNYIEKHKIEFSWKHGDVLMIDNSIMMHSRNSFVPPRTLYASIKHHPRFFKMRKNNNVLPSWDSIPINQIGISNNKKAEGIVKDAILEGYTCIHSEAYQCEKNMGKAIKACTELYDVSRKELFVISNFELSVNKSVEQTCLETLKDLQLDYLDMYILEFPKYLDDMDYFLVLEESNYVQNIWFQMENLVKKGLIRNIGLRNFPLNLLEELFSYCNILPGIVKIDSNPEYPQNHILMFCKKQNVQVCSTLPFGIDDNLLENKLVDTISKKYGCTRKQILLSWARMRKTSIVTNPETIRDMEEYSRHISLTQEEFEKLQRVCEQVLSYDDDLF